RRPLPTSALFPYTPLFRSLVDRRAETISQLVVDPAIRLLQTGICHIRQIAGGFHGGDLTGDVAPDDPHLLLLPEPAQRLGHLFLDRKSTRLNSSHVKISYA